MPSTAQTETRSGETAAHRRLKQLSAAWALAHRLSLCSTEVNLPRCNYRADVAASTPRVTAPNAVTAVFECKASRSDFLRDGADEKTVLAEIAALTVRVEALRRLIGQHCPDLRRGEELFPEFEAIDLRGVRHETHHRLTTALRIAQNKRLEGTKFSRLARWRCASLFYLVCEPELVAPHEVPDGWGLLIREGDELALHIAPVLHDTTPEQRIAFLERLAAASGRDMRRGLGVLATAGGRQASPGSTLPAERSAIG